MAVNIKARKIIEKVKNEHGLTFKQMAEICDVATGSIQRWYSTGRANGDRIRPLEEMIDDTRISSHKIVDNLIEIYRHVRRPFSLSANQLRDMSGRERMSGSIINEIIDEVYERNFILIQHLDDDERLLFLVIRKKWLTKHVKEIDKKTLEKYYSTIVDDEFDD